jgi:hypothetical protein
MSASVSVDTHSASFAAYCYLTLALPLELRREGYNVSFPRISYSDFVNEIETGRIVNPNYATSVLPPQVQTDFKVIESLYPEEGAAEFAWVRKAYELGMVNPQTNILVSNMDVQV